MKSKQFYCHVVQVWVWVQKPPFTRHYAVHVKLTRTSESNLPLYAPENGGADEENF